MGHTHTAPVGEGGVSRLVSWLNQWRVTAGIVMMVIVVGKSIYFKEAPHDLLNPTPLVWGALAMVFLGAGIRIAALGTLSKNQVLAQTGIYSLARHPLYIGSAVLYTGFALLMNSPIYLYLGLPYVVLFFSAAALSEEQFLRGKFGAEFEAYRTSVPGFIPLGQWAPGEFSIAKAMKKGGAQLIFVVFALLAGIELMAKKFGAG